MEYKSWNPVLNKFIEIKNAYINKFGIIKYEYTKENCLKIWVQELGIKEYIDLIAPLQLTQYEDLLLVRYALYSSTFNGEEELTLDNFWDIHDGFYRECRSVVINIKTNKLVLTPFRKFRNLNESKETNLINIQNKISNCKNCEVSDKLDGSMQFCRYIEELDRIIMAESQALDINNSWRLKIGYDMLYSDDDYIKMVKENKDYTFIFELISLQDAHVVNYTKDQEGLYLIGMRNVYTGEELSYADIIKYANKYNIKSTTIFNKSLEDILQELDNKKSNEAEGFVLNIDGFKVKIKYNNYVKIHRILSQVSSVNLIIENVANNTYDDLISKVPEIYRNRVNKVFNKILNFINEKEELISKYYNSIPKELDFKNTMIWIQKNVPKELMEYTIYKVKNIEYNLLIKKSGRYLKGKEIFGDEGEK